MAESGIAVAEPPEQDLVRVVPGHPAKVLLEEVRKLKAGILVLGAHGKRDLLDFGNTTRAIFARATVPVWVQSGPVTPIRSILVAVDLSHESLSALAMARGLAQVFEAEIRAVQCFHVDAISMAGEFEYSGYGPAYPVAEVRETDRMRFEKAMETFEWQGVPHRTEFLDGEPVRTLLELAESADLVVIGAHGRTGLASVLLGGGRVLGAEALAEADPRRARGVPDVPDVIRIGSPGLSADGRQGVRRLQIQGPPERGHELILVEMRAEPTRGEGVGALALVPGKRREAIISRPSLEPESCARNGADLPTCTHVGGDPRRLA